MPRPIRTDILPRPAPGRSPAEDLQARLVGDNQVTRREAEDLIRTWCVGPVTRARAEAIRGTVDAQIDRFDPGARSVIRSFVDRALPRLIIDPAGGTTPGTATNIAKLSWTPPTQNTDGTPLTDLAGYKVLFGRSPGNYTHEVTVNDPSATSFTVTGLTPGTWYFAVKSVDADGILSAPSGEVWKTIR